MELHKKIILGSFISVALVSCNTSDNVDESTPQGLTELKAVPQADIPAGFENTHMCKDVYLPGTDQEELLLKAQNGQMAASLL